MDDAYMCVLKARYKTFQGRFHIFVHIYIYADMYTYDCRYDYI
jgi:hypothetical protein